MDNKTIFPKDFVWGAATAAYQIEGAAHEGGRGPSIWDAFCKKPGAVFLGQSGDVACDHYHRYREDVGLMKDIGLQAYRLSISWSRVIPDGTGKVNEEGLAFYDSLIDELLAKGIQPYVTLFHWDMPLSVFDRGGWLNPECPQWFADYVKVVVERLSDRVTHWMTLNEPQVFMELGYHTGYHAPGLKFEMPQVLLMVHRVLLGHGLAVQTIREHAKKPPVIGWAPMGASHVPATESPADIEATKKVILGVGTENLWNNVWFADPVFLGHYPEEGLKAFGKNAPAFTEEEMRTICQPIDFYGLNIYQGQVYKAGPDGKPEMVPFPQGYPITAFGWKVTPGVLYWGLKFLYERYKKPIFMTENGLSSMDWVSVDGKVHDQQRIDFLTRYLANLRRAIQDGVDVRGYFQWSLMDNFEWADGYKQRFGLVYVDYPTQKRIPKASAAFYRSVIESNGAVIPPLEAMAPLYSS